MAILSDRRDAFAGVDFVKASDVSLKGFWKLAAIILVFLVVCPVTAPFSSYDFEAATNIHESLTGSKIAQDVPLPTPDVSFVSPVVQFLRSRGITVTSVADADHSRPLVLRL